MEIIIIYIVYVHVRSIHIMYFGDKMILDTSNKQSSTVPENMNT